MRPFFTLVLLLLATAPLQAAEKPALPAATALASLTYSAEPAAIEAIDRDLNAAGNDAAKLAAVEKQLWAALRQKDTTFASRQALCQRLGLILGQSPAKSAADSYKPLPAMLVDDRDSDLARLALDPAPGEAVDGIFVTALKKTSGRARLGIIDSIGRRRLATAVETLAPLLKNTDPSTAAAAARALGAIGTPAAAASLRAIPEPSSVVIAKAKLTVAARLPAAEATPLLRELEQNARDAAHRLAAFRMLLDVDPSSAVSRLTDVLSGSDWEKKQVALESVFASRAPNLTATLTSRLTSWDAPTQAAVIAALARRAAPAALPSDTVMSRLEQAADVRSAIITAATHRDADVRHAALEALGNFPGNRDTITLLARSAAGADSADAKIARQTLARLNGSDVNAAILDGAERGEPKLRVVYLEQLGQRNMTEGIPLLLKCRADSDSAVRLAAVGALGEIGSPAEQRALIDWTVGATNETEQSRGLRSLVTVISRDRSPDRGREFYATIERASPDVCLRLLPALQRIGGPASADCAVRLALRDDNKIAAAAVAALTRWNDRVALPALATVAQKAALPAARADALQGALGYFEKNRDAWTADTTPTVSALLDSTKEAAPRQRLLAVLGRANDKPALALAEKLKSDASFGAAAGETAEIIRSNLAGAPTLRASDNAASARNMIDGKPATRWNAETNGEEWVEIEFKASRPLHRITLDQTNRGTEFPEHYEIFVTDDAKNPGAARASGQGQRNKTVIDLPPGTRGRVVLIKNTQARAESQWSICELYVD